MARRRRVRPDYDEKIALDESLTYEEAVQRLLNAPTDEPENAEDVDS